MRLTRLLKVQSDSVFAFAVFLQVPGLKISRPRWVTFLCSLGVVVLGVTQQPPKYVRRLLT